MNIYEWTKDQIKDGIELWNDEIEYVNAKGAHLKRNTKRLREICLGVISSNSPEEWYTICRLNAPMGTICEGYIADLWEPLFNDVTALVRNALTKALLEERAAKSAGTLLNILSKRDKGHWSDDTKEKKVDVKTDNGMNVTFTVVE